MRITSTGDERENAPPLWPYLTRARCGSRNRAATGDYIKLIKASGRGGGVLKLLPRRDNKEVVCRRRHYYF